MDRQPLRHLSPSASCGWSRCRCSAARPTRRCAARSCTTRSAASPTRFPQALPADTCAELVALAERGLTELTGSPRVAAFWAPRFARFAAWFAETEPDRRIGVERSLAELEGSLVLESGARPFTLTARADRIDVAKAGLVITDYKTGGNIQDLGRRAKEGEAPQLPLEAAIALAGGFTGLPAGPVAALRYISGSGGEPPGLEHTLKNGDVATLARSAREGLERLIAAFDRESTPYGGAALPLPLSL